MTEMREKISPIDALRSIDVMAGNVIFNCEQRPSDNATHLRSWHAVKDMASQALAALLSQSSPSGGGMMCLPSPSAHQESSMPVEASRHVVPTENEGYEFHGYIILNHVGGIWSPRVFDSRSAALAYIWEQQRTYRSMDLSKHQVVEGCSVTYVGALPHSIAEAPPENTAKSEADVTSNQSLQEGMVLWPKYPTEAMFKRLDELTERDDIGFQTFNGDTGNWAWLLGELRLAASPSSISQEQEKGVQP